MAHSFAVGGSVSVSVLSLFGLFLLLQLLRTNTYNSLIINCIIRKKNVSLQYPAMEMQERFKNFFSLKK